MQRKFTLYLWIRKKQHLFLPAKTAFAYKKCVWSAFTRFSIYTICSSVLIETVKKTIIFSNCQKKQEFLTESNCVVKKLYCIKRTKQRLSTPTKKTLFTYKNCIWNVFTNFSIYKICFSVWWIILSSATPDPKKS